MTTDTQYEQLSAEEIQAWRDCRFVNLTVDHTIAFWNTNDKAVADKLPGRSDECLRVASDPNGLMEYAGRSSHPEAVALVLSLRAPKPGPFGKKP